MVMLSRRERRRIHEHELEDLRVESRYHHERLALYQARRYGGRPSRPQKLEELQRAAHGAAVRLRRAEAADRADKAGDAGPS